MHLTRCVKDAAWVEELDKQEAEEDVSSVSKEAKIRQKITKSFIHQV